MYVNTFLSIAIIARAHVLVNANVRFHVFFYILNKKGGVIMATLYETLSELCKIKGIKGGRMCTDLGISKSLMTDLKSGRKKGVSAATAQKIATYFGVSVGYLLGEEEREEKTKTIDEQLTGIDFAMWSEAKDMTDAEKQDILNYIKFKKSQRNE